MEAVTAAASTVSRQIKAAPGCVALGTEECQARARGLSGKVVVVTGAASGFGRAYAVAAAGYGAKLVVSDIRSEPLKDLVEEIRAAGGTAIYCTCDTTSWDDQVAMFDLAVASYKVVDVVIPNAGVPEMGGWSKETLTKDGKLERPNLKEIDINILGAVYTTKLGLFHFGKNSGPGPKSIVVMGSMSSFFGIPGGLIYTTTKHAMLGFFRSLHNEGLAAGVNVSIVCPWFVATPILGPAVRLLLAGLPLASVSSVVEAMLYASNPPTSGQTLCVDAEGVLSVPSGSIGIGEQETDNYYSVFQNRARFALTLQQRAKDVKAVLQEAGGLTWLVYAPILALITPLLYQIMKNGLSRS